MGIGRNIVAEPGGGSSAKSTVLTDGLTQPPAWDTYGILAVPTPWLQIAVVSAVYTCVCIYDIQLWLSSIMLLYILGWTCSILWSE